MGRAGASSGGHSHSSGGHRSSSHGSSGHRSSSSRSGSSSSRSSYSSSSYRSSYSGSHRSSYGRSYHSGVSWGSYKLYILVVIAFFAICSLASAIQKHGYTVDIPSTIVREKLTNVPAFDADCIVDELNWFDYPNQAGKQLKEFYDKTGVQPYVKLLDYNPNLSTDEEKEKWADEDYDNGGYADNAFVYYYFGEYYPDDVGYMYVCYGNRAGTVFDSEALDIFWQQLDSMWTNGDISTDKLFADSFNNTAKKIMTVSKTVEDVVWIVIAAIMVIVLIVGIIVIIRAKAKAAHQKREDELKILNSDINNPML